VAAGLLGELAQVAEVRSRLGCDQRTAELLLALARKPGADTFYVRQATLMWAPQGETGVRLELINLIPVVDQ
jgi:hypothetical protein